MLMEFNEKAAEIFEKIHKKRPLLHHITNYVVMNDTANLTLHIGASPVMAHARDEMNEMTSMAGALILNIGTLSNEWIVSMMIAGQKANELKIPIILDPVGAGATIYRTQTALNLLKKLKISILRGNSGEIGALSGAGGRVKGVDSIEGMRDPAKVAGDLARSLKTVVVITGKKDIISNGRDLYYVDNGHELLSTITGSGCMATTMIAAFAAVENNYALAAAAAISVYGLSAEIAALKSLGPASFKITLFDTIYNLTPGQIKKYAKITKS